MELSGSIISFVRFIFCTKRFKRVVYDSKWSHLPGPVMDCLTTELKRIGRWKIDGPNLRCVNKHWRDQIDSRITHIRPLGNVKFRSMTLERLSKMSNVKHLRLDPFLSERGILESRERFKARVNSLRTLTNLTDLELRGSSSRHVLLCSSDCFQNVTSVVFNDISFDEGQYVLPLRSSPVRELTFIGKPCLQILNSSWFGTLRSLDFRFESERSLSLERLTQLDSLTSLSIVSKNSRGVMLKNVEMLSHLPSLVSLHLPDSQISLPFWITTLSNLESLVLKIFNYPVDEGRIWELMESLRSLRSIGLMQAMFSLHHVFDFYLSATKLRSLEYLSFVENDGIPLSWFTRLTRLCIHLDCTHSNVLEVFQLPLLEECFIMGRFLHLPHRSQHNIVCENLIVLEILVDVGYVNLDAVTCFRSLKKLCLYNCYNISFAEISNLRLLPYLKELCLFGSTDHGHIKYTRGLRALFEKLDLLCISGCCPYLRETPWLHQSLPQVRIIGDVEDFLNVSQIGTRSPSAARYLR